MLSDALPPIGLGTWKNTDSDGCRRTVATALEAGYRHVDTAQYYGNEQHVGAGIAAADIPREEIVLATKIHPELTGLGREDVFTAAEASCDRLDVDVLDLLYVHWPIGDYDATETLGAFEELRDRGVVRHVCVSNFSVDLVEEAADAIGRYPFANQVEMHPLLPQEQLLAHAQAHDYHLIAYSPLAQGRVFDVPEVQSVAEKHGVSEAQVSLAWLCAKDNVVAVPKATDQEHIRDNRAARNLTLSPADVDTIDQIDRETRFVERDGAPWLSS